jgi:hypothetical protein
MKNESRTPRTSGPDHLNNAILTPIRLRRPAWELIPVLLRNPDRTAFEGVTPFEFVTAFPATHMFTGADPSKLLAHFRAIDFEGKLLPKWWAVECRCPRVERRDGTFSSPPLKSPCPSWQPKGPRSDLYRDATIGFGTFPAMRDLCDPAAFCEGRLISAQVEVVKETQRFGSSKRRHLPEALWHSRVGCFVRLAAGGRP